MRRLNYFDDNIGASQSAWLKSTIYMCIKTTALSSINFYWYPFYVRLL